MEKQVNVKKLIKCAENLDCCKNNNGLISIIDILQELNYYEEYHIEQIENYVYQWLDKECNNEPYTRWTDHGRYICHQFEESLKIYNNEFKKN